MQVHKWDNEEEEMDRVVESTRQHTRHMQMQTKTTTDDMPSGW